jgi:hypothetical protein
MLLAARKKSILDTSTADLVSLSSKLPGSEKQKVDTFAIHSRPRTAFDGPGDDGTIL